MPRGGKRSGTPGRSYTNRSDLNRNRVPIAAAPGQTYGKGKEQIDAQRAIPIAPAPTPVAGGAPVDPMQKFKDYDLALPGRPDQTQRPDEPLTAGMDRGPGPGSEILPQFTRTNGDLEHLRPYLPLLERLVSSPDAAPSTRVFYRQLLASFPVT